MTATGLNCPIIVCVACGILLPSYFFFDFFNENVVFVVGPADIDTCKYPGKNDGAHSYGYPYRYGPGEFLR